MSFYIVTFSKHSTLFLALFYSLRIAMVLREIPNFDKIAATNAITSGRLKHSGKIFFYYKPSRSSFKNHCNPQSLYIATFSWYFALFL